MAVLSLDYKRLQLVLREFREISNDAKYIHVFSLLGEPRLSIFSCWGFAIFPYFVFLLLFVKQLYSLDL